MKIFPTWGRNNRAGLLLTCLKSGPENEKGIIMSTTDHPVSTERVEEVVGKLIKFMDSSGICLVEGKLAMKALLDSFAEKNPSTPNTH